MQNLCACIIAGGVGSRFWPASREHLPKQFLDITGDGRSMLRATVDRLLPLVPIDRFIIVTNEKYRHLVKEHIPEVSDRQIIGEPAKRNTAPAALLGTMAADQMVDGHAIVITTPADQQVRRPDRFREILEASARHAASNKDLVTIGIEPTFPHTGYGYIKYNPAERMPARVAAFTEKPNLETARKFLASEKYVWNAGIFVWNSVTLYEAFQQYAPDMWADFEPLRQSFTRENLISVFDKVQAQSIDYEIMERAQNVVTFKGDFGWSDVGSWRVIHEILDKDEDNNVHLCDKHVIRKCRNSLFKLPKDKLMVAKGLDDFIVIDTGDVLVIYPKKEDQELKEIRAGVIDKYGDMYK